MKYTGHSFWGDKQLCRKGRKISLVQRMFRLSQWLQQKSRFPAAAAAALQACHGRGFVRSVASSMKARTVTCTSTRMKWTMSWCATSVCSPWSNLWTPLVVTPIAFIAWATSWRSRTSAPWTASGYSCTSAVPPACWSGTCWTSWLWCALTMQTASSRCNAVNYSLTCTIGKTPVVVGGDDVKYHRHAMVAVSVVMRFTSS